MNGPLIGAVHYLCRPKKGRPRNCLPKCQRNCVFAGFNQLSVPKISYPSRHVAKISTTFKIAAPPIKRRDRTLIVDTHFFRLHWIFKILKRVCHAFLNKTRMVTLLPNERSERLRTPPIVSCCRIVAREVYPCHLLELVSLCNYGLPSWHMLVFVFARVWSVFNSNSMTWRRRQTEIDLREQDQERHQ